MTPLVPRVVSSRRYDLGLRTQVRPYAGEAVTELVSQAGRVLCVGDRGFAAKPCLGRWHISAESLAKKLSTRKDSPELREKGSRPLGRIARVCARFVIAFRPRERLRRR